MSKMNFKDSNLKKYDEIMMKTAELWAQQSKCIRKQVGAVIAKDNRIISIGYNGTPSSYKEYDQEICNCCEGKGTIGFNLNSKEITCNCCGGLGYIEMENKYDCEKEIKKLVSKCCHAEIIEDKEKMKLYCSKCKKEIGWMDQDNSGLDFCRWVGDFVEYIELKTDHNKVIHAEANAILFAAKEGIPLKDTTLYVTMSPCSECAKMIIQSGIKRVMYKEDYRIPDGIKLLKNCGVIVEKVEM